MLGNGGYDVKPTLICKVVETDAAGKYHTLLDNTSKGGRQEKHRLIDPDITRQVVCAMKYVTKPGGAASKADINGYTEAGKTSTTEKLIGGTYSTKDHVSTFIGFAPAENPKLAIAVVVDEPYPYYYGGVVSAPVFKEIAEESLKYIESEERLSNFAKPSQLNEAKLSNR